MGLLLQCKRVFIYIHTYKHRQNNCLVMMSEWEISGIALLPSNLKAIFMFQLSV